MRLQRSCQRADNSQPRAAAKHDDIVGHFGGERVGVSFGNADDRLDTQGAARADHPHRDFAAIRHEHAPDVARGQRGLCSLGPCSTLLYGLINITI